MKLAFRLSLAPGVGLIITIMGQRKKNQNKQNFKACKKPLLQQIQYTEELRIPTLATMDLRQAARSIQLKKSSSKKPASRKSRCISVKQAGVQQPLRLKQLLKQFKSMKLIQGKEKSRSPRSSKSRPKTRKSTKKITQFNSKNSSELNLTIKLEKTIKKLKADNFFRDDEDSEIPFVSTSQAYTQSERRRIEFVVGDNEQEINIREMRLFCKNSDQNCFRKSIEYFKGNIYDSMARRIQRAWRSYRTHQLVTRYTNIFMNFDISDRSEQMSRRQESEAPTHNQIMIESQQLYPEEMQQRKVTYISNLEEEQENGEIREVREQKQEDREDDEPEDEELKAIKMEQLQKWKQIISLISKTKNDNPAETQKLFKKLVIKSELNKLSLENSRHNSEGAEYSSSSEQNREVEEEDQEQQEQQEEDEEDDDVKIRKYISQKREQRNQQNSSSFSGDSYKNQQEDEFNSKKYIEYLDSDMYPIVAMIKQSGNTICKEKQELLIMKLTERKPIFSSKILASGHENVIDTEIRSRLSHRSISDFSNQTSQLDDELNSERRKNQNIQDRRLKRKDLRKSTSQKFIKKPKTVGINSIEDSKKDQAGLFQYNKEYDIEKKPDQKDLVPLNETLQDFMRRELDEYEFESEDVLQYDGQFNKLYSEEELIKKMADLKRLKQEDSDQENQFIESRGSSESDSAPILHRSCNPPLHKINIEDFDRNIDSDEDEQDVDIGEKAEAITDLLFNNLMTEVLRDLAKYPDTIIQKFKQLGVRVPKIKRAPQKPKKYGFVTNLAEIKLFIEQICSYVLNEEPHVFKNLEKATGPSALEMLRYMHQSADDEIYLDEEEDDPSVMVLPNWIFDNFWAQKAVTLKYEKQGIADDKEQQRQEYLKSLNKIFLRSCFDCLNECLDFERNFGSFGRPFPWKKSHLFDHVKQLEETKKNVANAQKKLFQISATYCGIIIEKEEMLTLCGSEQYVTQVQEDRLSRMLAQDLVEGEDRWIFYDDEETQLLVECSNVIFYELLMEFYKQISILSQ